MPRFVLIFFCLAATAVAQEVRAPSPKPKIATAEEALLRFREARDGEIKAKLSETDFQKHDFSRIVSFTQARSLSIRCLQPRNYQPPFDAGSAVGGGLYAARIYGRFEAASSCKNETWELVYLERVTRSSTRVYLDAVTGEVLCIIGTPGE